MKKILCVFVLTAMSLYGAEIPVKNGTVTATLETRGGALTALAYHGKSLVQSKPSFTDRILSNQLNDGKKEQVTEPFGTLEFNAEILKADYSGTTVQFSTRGIGAFDWLRLTKTYRFQKNNPEFQIEYKLENLDTKIHNAGVWTKSLLRRDDGVGIVNNIYQPREKELKILTHPGSGISMDEWSTAPMYAWLAVCGRDDKTGVMVLLPQNMVSAFYSWFDLAKSASTLEWFIRDQKIPAKGSVAFTVKIVASKDIPAEVNNIKYYRTLNPQGEALYLPYFYAGQEKGVAQIQKATGTLPKSTKYMNVNVVRQYNDSIPSVRLPATVTPAEISVYEISNGQADDTRPVPFSVKKLDSGEYQLLFKVPGLNPNGFYETKFGKDGSVSRLDGRYVGNADYPVQIMLDRKAVSNVSSDGFDGGANLIYNGDFTKKAPYGDWPDGFYWAWSIRDRKWYQYKDGVITMTRPSEKDWTQFPVFFRVEPGKKYTVSVKVRNDNRCNGSAVASVSFMDADGKEIKNSGMRFYDGTRSHDWKVYEKTFYAPEHAFFGKFNILTFGVKEQNVSIDDLKVVPEDIPYVQKSHIDRMRDQLKNAWYKPLDNLESISHAYVTEHKKWMNPAAFELPELLYLVMNRGELESPKRRTIVELAQRMSLKYKYIPLLSRITNISGGNALGVIPPQCAPELEPYTMERLKGIAETPKVILIQGVNFNTNVQKEFAARIDGWQKDGSSVLFVNCKNIPPELLGTSVKRPSELMLIPEMRKLNEKQLDKFLALYQKGNSRNAVYQNREDDYYVALRNIPCVPESQVNEKCPAYVSRDFPYWEYSWLPLLKTVRWMSGTTPDAAFRQFNGKEGKAVFQIRAEKDLNAKLEIAYQDLHRQTHGVTREDVTLRKGDNTLSVSLPALPGGLHIAEYKMIAPDGKIYDAGASRFDTPETVSAAIEFASKDRCYSSEKPVVFSVNTANAPADSIVKTVLEDTNGREVFVDSRKNASVNSYSVKLLPPFTTLYRVMVKVEHNGKILASRVGEFSVNDRAIDAKDMTGIIWLERAEMNPLIKELGYDMIVASHHQNGDVWGRFRNHRNLDIAPLIVGSGYVRSDMGLAYRHDIPSDPVRKPCYSDLKRQEGVRGDILKSAEANKYRYYNIRHHFLGDELYLGSTVCYSPSCLEGFRESLKKQYGSLDALNRHWDTAFKTWDEVMPCQFKELKNKENLSRWLDHKMFMAGVFAHQYMGKTNEFLQEAAPGSMSGMSGTQLPGFSYDWAQLMKHIRFIAYYDGVQGKLVHDFGSEGTLSGLWSCGYVDTSVRRDPYQHANLWRSLFQGANLAPNYGAGSTINGDLSINSNIEEYSKVMREMKRGSAKLVLSSAPANEKIAVLYSQPSLFAAMGSIGSNEWQNAQSGWYALLNDLNVNFRFVSYEDLTKGIHAEKFNVLILPAAIALSSAQTKSLEQFVKDGGTLIADFAPGYFDEHGRRNANPELAALFGVKTAGKELKLTGKSLRIPAVPAEGIPAVNGDFRVGDASLPVMNVNRVGKGRAILMNLLLNGYQTIQLEGVGGELSSTVSGAEVFCRNLRGLIRGILYKTGIKERCIVTTAQGTVFPCLTMLRENGGNLVLGIMKYSVDGATFDRTKGTEVTVKLPVKGYIYNVREQKFVTYGDTFRTKLTPGWAELYTVLKHKIDAVELTVPAVVKRGSVCNTGFKTVASGQPGPQVFHLEVIRPDGKTDPVYSRNVETADGSGSIAFQTAWNDPAGKWTIRVTNVNTGLSAQKSCHFE